MKYSLFSRCIVLTVCVAVSGCLKEYSEDLIEEEIITQNAAIGQELADDILDMVYQTEILLKYHPGALDTLSGTQGFCGVIFNDVPHKVFAIVYNSECPDARGSYHFGLIQVAYSTTLGDTLSDRLVTFDQYAVDGKKIEGTITLHDFDILPDGAYVAVRSLNDLKITFPDGSGITFNGSHDRVWTSGRGDTLENNNRYTYRGSMSGTSSSGRTFTQEVTTPFITDFYAVSQGHFARTYGVVELSTLQGYPARTRTVDYGRDSTLYDDNVTVTTFRRTYGYKTD